LQEYAPATLKLAIRIEGRASRRQQHHRLGYIGSFGVGGGPFDRALECPDDQGGHASLKLRGEVSCGLADEIGLADARKKRSERGDASGLSSATRNPENVREAGR